MTNGRSSSPNRVVIVGGGVGGLEALLALRALAGDRVGTTLVSQEEWFVDRPVTVAEPFGKGSSARHSLSEISAELGAEFVHGTVSAVDAARHRVSLAGGSDVAFDTLILTPGARLQSPFADAITFGMGGSVGAFKEMLDRLRAGEMRSAAFVAPGMTGWLLPLYELALMTARELAQSKVQGVQLHLVTPEDRPLALFGESGSQSVARLLDAAGIEFIGSTIATVAAGEVTLNSSRAPVAVECAVTLPLLRGPGLAGVPATPRTEFVPVDEYGRVEGLADVYAAGDAVDFAVKQGGLAAQQADTVAAHVAAKYGAHVEPAPFQPVLRGMLFTGGEPRFMRSEVAGAESGLRGAWHPLWWPPTKIAGRHLAPYMFARADVEGFGVHPEGFVDVDVALTAATLPG